MSDEAKQPGSTEAKPEEVECPMCKHRFLHKIGDGLKKAGGEILNGIGNAIGEEKFGG